MEDVEILENVNIDNKNKYEESIKAFADKLEEKINHLKEKKQEVEQSARDSFNEKIELLKKKRQYLLDSVLLPGKRT